MEMDRANVSRHLNNLSKAGKIIKLNGRLVLYTTVIRKNEENQIIAKDIDSDNSIFKLEKNKDSLEKLVGAEKSLKMPIQQTKAAILYPPRGLHTLILGETGVGKSLFAEMMYNFAKESKSISY